MEQMLLSDFTFVTESGNFLGRIEEPKEENYLQRGEKIFSLLRNKKRKAFIPSSVFESISRKTYLSKNTYGRYDYLLSCGEKILRRKWEKACEEEDLSSFFAEIGDITRVSKVEEGLEVLTLLKDLTKKQTFEGAVEFQYGEKVYYAPLGKVKLTKRQNGGSWGYRSSRNRYTIIDVPKHFRKHYFYSEMRNRVKDALKDLNEEQLIDNRIAKFLRDSISKVFESYTDERGLIKFRKVVLEEPYVRDYIKEYNFPVCEANTSSIRLCEMMPLWFLSNAPYKNDVEAFSGFIIKLFDLLYSVYIEDKQSDMFNKNLATEYARVYETKKAIPQKMISAMEKSGFNDYFGYVEFDAECDIKKIKEIEKEFRALQNIIFHQDGRKEDVSLRFRKLGRHKASGLYFPSLKCLCVDVRSPSSMAHEYGHMLDHEAGDISKGVKFSKARFLYQDLFLSAMEKLPKDNPERLRLEGKTKYNKDYYLEPTEIFSRSLEVYLVEVLKVDNSLVKPTEGRIAYPDDENYLIAITEFFDDFFGQIAAARAVASN